MNVLWFPRALDDLEDIRAFVERDDPGSAAVIVHRLRDAAERLSAFPDAGRRGHVSGTRELVVPRLPYILVYRRRGETIGILRVLHGARRRPGR